MVIFVKEIQTDQLLYRLKKKKEELYDVSGPHARTTRMNVCLLAGTNKMIEQSVVFSFLLI